ncbi:MAG: GTPase ObgE [Clostridia bacterium]|nr:GTPase ObgE [Clostridia bacterium]
MFIDRAKILVRSGNGGNGCVAFHREKYVNAGGPDGGDGGRGGDVIFAVDERMSTLIDFRFKRKFVAQSGGNGRTCKMTGKSGENLVIGVPKGTLIFDNKSGRLLADLVESGQQATLARGGRGGQGNQHFATATRQVPNFARAGEEGKELELRLELKLLADVGLVGYPSVGKSTLLSVTTAAKPEIAEYHFTTLVPNLGVVYNGGERSFVLADIPGLIEGASEGVGLGHEFLRHIERTRLILHVIDISGSEGRDPFEDFLTINRELAQFNESLAARPQIIVLNKTDMPGSDEQLVIFKEKFNNWLSEHEELNDAVEKGAYRIFEVMAAIAEGTRELMLYTASILDHFPQEVFAVEELPADVSEQEEAPFTVSIDPDGAYNVQGAWVKNLAASINMTDEESSRYFQMQLKKKGLFDILREMGIQDDDTVRIYDFEFDYME